MAQPVYRRGSLGVRTSSGTTGTAAFELIAPVERPCYLKEMMLTLVAATASTFGLGRPAALGITPTSPIALLSEVSGDNTEEHTKTALAWGTGPTLPAAFYRRIGFPATVNSQINWVFSRGLFIPAGGSLVLWNLGTNSVLDLYVVVDE